MARENGWIDLYRRTGGKLSYGEALAAPMLLVDVFDALDELAVQAASYARQVRAKAREVTDGR